MRRGETGIHDHNDDHDDDHDDDIDDNDDGDDDDRGGIHFVFFL